MNVSLTSGLDLLYTSAFTVSHENGFVNYDFQQLTLILGFCAPKNGNNGLIRKNYCIAIEMPELLLSLNLLTSWTLVIANFSAPKKLSRGGGGGRATAPRPPRHCQHGSEFLHGLEQYCLEMQYHRSEERGWLVREHILFSF